MGSLPSLYPFTVLSAREIAARPTHNFPSEVTAGGIAAPDKSIIIDGGCSCMEVYWVGETEMGCCNSEFKFAAYIREK